MIVPDFDHFVTSGHQMSAVMTDINCCTTTAMNIINLSTRITDNHKLMPTLLTLVTSTDWIYTDIIIIKLTSHNSLLSNS